MLADVTLHCGMYPAGKVEISQHVSLPFVGFQGPQQTPAKKFIFYFRQT
jgi:hypothetical protein